MKVSHTMEPRTRPRTTKTFLSSATAADKKEKLHMLEEPTPFDNAHSERNEFLSSVDADRALYLKAHATESE